MDEYDYIIDAFTQSGNDTNLEVDNLTVGCISSKNNNFSLDSNGNLTVNSITTSGGGIDFDLIYPVGSVYISVVNTNPGTLFGGTWEEINGKFLLAQDTNHAAGTTGGVENVTLTQNQMPSSVPAIRAVGTNEYSCGVWKKNGTGYGLNLPGQYGTSMQGQSHNNMPPYLSVYMWKRTL